MRWLQPKGRGYRHYCGNATPERLSRYAAVGFRTAVLGPPALLWASGASRFGSTSSRRPTRLGISPLLPCPEAGRAAVSRSVKDSAPCRRCNESWAVPIPSWTLVVSPHPRDE